MSHVAYIALGSNLGYREHNLRQALAMLHDPPTLLRQQFSRIFETPPVDCPPDTPSFLNAVTVVTTTLSPRALLNRLLQIEAELGRERPAGVINAPRPIDLDLLLYDDRVINEPDLIIPHPRLHERAFVLEPLVDVARDAWHPILQKTAAELLQELEARRGPRVDVAPAISAAVTAESGGAVLPAEPVSYWDRLNWFDYGCAFLAGLLAIALIVIGVPGLFIGSEAHVHLSPIFGGLPVLVGWGILKSIIVAARAGTWQSGSDPRRGFPVEVDGAGTANPQENRRDPG